MPKTTEVSDLSTFPDTGEVMFVVRRFDDGQVVAVHRARHFCAEDVSWIISNINGQAPDYPPISEADAAAIQNTFAACPPYTPPAPTLEELRTAKRVAIDIQAQLHSEAPFEWDFGEIEALDDGGLSVGSAGVQTLQVRGVIDEKNWLAAHAGAVTALIGGAPSLICPIKTTANVWVQTTAADLIAVLVAGEPGRLSLLQRQKDNLGRHGALKKACAEAEDEAALEGIDETTGWPA